MTVDADSTILLVNEAKAENSLWSVGALTTGARTIMEGNIVASAAMAFGANNDITGRLSRDPPSHSVQIMSGAASFVTVVEERSRNLSVNSSPTNRDSSPSLNSLLSETALQYSRALQEAAAPFELAEFQVNAGADSTTDSAFLTTLSAHAFLALSFTLAFAMFG
jgi:hypothetical protein